MRSSNTAVEFVEIYSHDLLNSFLKDLSKGPALSLNNKMAFFICRQVA